MVLCSIQELCIGLRIIQNGEPCVIVHNESVKPGKGQAFNRVRFKQIKSGKILEKTFKSGESIELADIIEMSLVYMYRDNEFWVFMNEKNFEQILVHSSVVGGISKWMVAQLRYVVTLWNKTPILVIPPNYIELSVVKTTPAVKSTAVSSGTKLAIVSTGAVVKVPFFIQSKELIKIDTRSGEYISRVK